MTQRVRLGQASNSATTTAAGVAPGGSPSFQLSAANFGPAAARPGQGSGCQGGSDQIGKDSQTLEMLAVFHQPAGKERQGQFPRGVDPERGGARAHSGVAPG